MFENLFTKSDLPLTEEEIVQRKQRLRKIAVIAGVVVLLLLIGAFSARPVINVVRAWQARRHAYKAFELIEQQNWPEARKEAVAAYQLRSNEPEAIRSVARLLSRAGQHDALGFWKQLAEVTRLTRADLRDQAGIALRSREVEAATAPLQELLSDRDGGPSPTDWLLAAELAIQRQEMDTAMSHTRRVFAASNASSREQFQATVMLDKLLRARDTKDRSEVLHRLVTIAKDSDDVALDALVSLGQSILATNAAWPESAGMSVDQITQALEQHARGKTPHKLLATDLKIRQHPEEKDALIQAAVEQWKNGDTADLVALAGWLNTRGEYQRELDNISRERAMQNRDLFFQHVDALGALGKWDEIRRLIESEQFPLDPVIAHMYLARCFAQQNQMGGAENNWTRALEAAAGDSGKLMILGEYAEKNGVFNVAQRAFEAAVATSPKSRPAQQARLRMAYVMKDTRAIHAILTDLLSIWPNDPAVMNDEAYARLLLLPVDVAKQDAAASDSSPVRELKRIEDMATGLVQRAPTSLPHRTVLALALLKQNRPFEALAVYKDITVPQTALTTSSIAVHAAVLAATGHSDQAKVEIERLSDDKLLPEEKALIGR